MKSLVLYFQREVDFARDVLATHHSDMAVLKVSGFPLGVSEDASVDLEKRKIVNGYSINLRRYSLAKIGLSIDLRGNLAINPGHEISLIDTEQFV